MSLQQIFQTYGTRDREMPREKLRDIRETYK